MATLRWVGGAAAVAQVTTLTPANVEATDIFTVQMGSRILSYTAGAATVADVTAGIHALINAETDGPFAEVTSVDSTTHVTLTADTAGKAFEVTTSTTDGGGTDNQTFVAATTTANEGPEDFLTAENWDLGQAPANSDTLIIENYSGDILYNLSTSLTGLTIHVMASFTGQIGLPEIHASGYYQPRTTYLTIDGGTITIGSNSGAGSGRLKFDSGSSAATFYILKTATSVESGVPACLVKGTNITYVRVQKGDVGIAWFKGEVSTVTTIAAAYQSAETSDVTVRCGTGCTLTTVTMGAGTVYAGSAITTLTINDGTFWYDGSGGITTMHVRGSGTAKIAVTGTITTANVSDSGTLDFGIGPPDVSATVTTLNLYKGASVLDPDGRITFSTVNLVKTSLPDLGVVDFGTDISLSSV